MIKISINLTKLDKTRFFQGKNGTYCNLVIFENREPDQFGNDYTVKQDCTKEDRDNGVQMPYVGNGKNLGGGSQQRPQQQQRKPYPQRPAQNESDPQQHKQRIEEYQKVEDDQEIPF